MTSTIQRPELQNIIWKKANEVCGAKDGCGDKQFVLGALFYYFTSVNFTNYIEGVDYSVDFASLADSVITTEIKDVQLKL